MALTSAQRQQRFRERHGSVRAGVSAPVVAQPTGSVGLTEKQIADREAVMACSLFPIGVKYDGSLFMGMGPNAWRRASDEIVDYFDMRDAKARWDVEWKAYEDQQNKAHHRAKEIVALVGSRADKIWGEQGAMALCKAYDADPTLGRKRQPSKMKRGTCVT